MGNLMDEIRKNQTKPQPIVVENVTRKLSQMSTDDLLKELERVQKFLKEKESEMMEDKAIEVSIITILYDRGGYKAS